MRSMPLALLGGSFDPVHNGHLRMAMEAALALDATVALLPSGTPPHRSSPVASPAQRLAMIELALSGQDRVTVDPRELSRPGVNYTVDTLRELRDEIGPQRPLVLLIGTDQFALLDSWYRWQSIFEYAHIGVLGRAGVTSTPSASVAGHVSTRWAAASSDLSTRPAGHAVHIDTTLLDISASRIRNDLASGKSPRWLLPVPVLEYISEHRLYERGHGLAHRNAV